MNFVKVIHKSHASNFFFLLDILNEVEGDEGEVGVSEMFFIPFPLKCSTFLSSETQRINHLKTSISQMGF
jgi:hypothetical protein